MRMQLDLDALKTESLGSILRECSFIPTDLVCVLFSLDGLNLNESADPVDKNNSRVVGAVPLEALLDAATSVVAEHVLQNELMLERKQLVSDGVFIPMLRYEHSIEHSQHSKISGGMIPPHDTGISTYPSSSYLDDNSSRLWNAMSQNTDGSSRIDV